MLLFYSTQIGSATTDVSQEQSIITATYLSGLGNLAEPIAEGDEMAKSFAPLVVGITSVETQNTEI